MELYKTIEQLNSKERIIIGIDGPSGSGKSTLADTLEKRYDALVIHIDDFFLPISMKTKERLSEVGGNFHYERFIEEVINNLDNKIIPYHKFNCKDESSVLLEEENKRIIVIEGCYSHHSLLRECYDILVFMDVDRDVQLSRIKARSGEQLLQRFINEWIPLEDKYFEAENLRKLADIIIKN